MCVALSLSRPSGRVGSNDPLSLSSTESSPTSHAKSQRPSNPNRFPMCATVAIGTQIETRIDHPIAARRAPPWPWEPSSKPESSGKSHANSNRKSTPKSIQNRCQIDPRRVKMTPRSGPGVPRRPRRVPGGSSRASWDALGSLCVAFGGSLGASWGALGRLLGGLGTPPGSTKVAKERPQTPQRRQNPPPNVSQDRKAGQPGSESSFDIIFA